MVILKQNDKLYNSSQNLKILARKDKSPNPDIEFLGGGRRRRWEMEVVAETIIS